uniref:Uncharacterized protein n=1 Tax=Rhizophora mucronata TaxID=61149 RepID=A0A2P2PFI6_RHIMU
MYTHWKNKPCKHTFNSQTLTSCCNFELIYKTTWYQ